jgi:Carboxypeptidase regulatory-like domain
MDTRHSILIAAAVICAAAVTSVSAGPAGPRPAVTHGTVVLGHAWTANNAAIPYARVRLRDVATAHVKATTVANEAGQFAFSNIEPGSYVVELVDESNRILTVGRVFDIARGQTVGTFVRLGGKAPWYEGFFFNTAAAAASSAASQGITALAPVARPASRAR